MNTKRVLITGAGGMLARAIQREFLNAGAYVMALNRERLDVTNEKRVKQVISDSQPDFVIQCAAYTQVDDAETNENRAFTINAAGTLNVANACAHFGAKLVYPSTDYVFDGTASHPYAPDAPINPINAYGRSKAAGEEAARQAGKFLIVRTSWLYGDGGKNFVRTIANRLTEWDPIRVVDDQYGSPTWTADLAATILGLLDKNAPAGVYHASNAGITTWYELACEIKQYFDSAVEVQACTSEEYHTRSKRPGFSVLDCSKTQEIVGPMREWRVALDDALSTGAY